MFDHFGVVSCLAFITVGVAHGYSISRLRRESPAHSDLIVHSYSISRLRVNHPPTNAGGSDLIAHGYSISRLRRATPNSFPQITCPITTDV
jgi:hypothetical protein